MPEARRRDWIQIQKEEAKECGQVNDWVAPNDLAHGPTSGAASEAASRAAPGERLHARRSREVRRIQGAWPLAVQGDDCREALSA